MSGSPSPQFSELFERATDDERRHATAVAATVRLGGAALFLMLALLMWKVGGHAHWEFYLPPLAIYLAAALLTFRFRRWPALLRFSWMPPFIDVAFVYAMQSRAIALSDSPGAIAGFSLGLFVVLVGLSGLTMRPRLIYAVAAVAAAGELLIMRDAAMTISPMIASPVVLLLSAVVSHTAFRRVQRLAMDLVQAEVARRLESTLLVETESARKSAEMSLIETQAQNERLGRLQRDKESLVQLIVHDLRSPVNAMTLSLEYMAQELRRGVRADGELMEALDDARATADRLTAMITQILDTAKLEEGRLKLDNVPLRADELLESARQHATSMARSKTLAVKVETTPGLAFCGDPRLFPRLIENLVSNSMRHAPNGGKILLRAAKVDDHYRLSVHNNGAPIDQQDRERIFDKFHQGEAQRLSGWGLGLYFCRMVVEAHGGRITVEDVDGWPTSFVIRLPAKEVTLARKSDGGTAPASGQPAGKAASPTAV